jgi:hypothetical protein
MLCTFHASRDRSREGGTLPPKVPLRTTSGKLAGMSKSSAGVRSIAIEQEGPRVMVRHNGRSSDRTRVI